VKFFLHSTNLNSSDEVVKGFLIGFPNGHVFWDATEYLIVRANIDSVNTLYNSALYLVNFFNYLLNISSLDQSSSSEIYESKVYSIKSIDLEEYLDFLFKGKNQLKASSANQNLSTIVSFYWWLQVNAKTNVKYLCGWADIEKKNPVHQIKVLPCKSNRTNKDYINPYRKRILSPSTPLFVPTRNQVNLLSELVIHKANKMAPKNTEDMAHMYRIRNLLVFDWMSQAALRREEARLLRCETVERALLQAKAETDGLQKHLALINGEALKPKLVKKMINVLVKHGAKGGMSRMVQVTPELLDRTISYIDFERAFILNSGHCRDTGEVFITTANKRKNCSASMSDTYISSLVTFELDPDASKRPLVRCNQFKTLKVTPHALRRYAITNYGSLLLHIERLNRRAMSKASTNDFDSMLNKLKRFAGHNSIDTTLKYYFDLSQAIVNNDIGSTRAEVEYLRQLLAMLENKLI